MKIEEFYKTYPSLRGLQANINTQSKEENYEDAETFLNEVYYIEMINVFDVMNCNIYREDGWRRVDKVYSNLFRYEKVITDDYVGISIKFIK